MLEWQPTAHKCTYAKSAALLSRDSISLLGLSQEDRVIHHPWEVANGCPARRYKPLRRDHPLNTSLPGVSFRHRARTGGAQGSFDHLFSVSDIRSDTVTHFLHHRWVLTARSCLHYCSIKVAVRQKSLKFKCARRQKATTIPTESLSETTRRVPRSRQSGEDKSTLASPGTRKACSNLQRSSRARAAGTSSRQLPCRPLCRYHETARVERSQLSAPSENAMIKNEVC